MTDESDSDEILTDHRLQSCREPIPQGVLSDGWWGLRVASRGRMCERLRLARNEGCFQSWSCLGDIGLRNIFWLGGVGCQPAAADRLRRLPLENLPAMLQDRVRLRCGGQLERLRVMTNDTGQDDRTKRESAHPFEDAGALRRLADRPA
jgi:hypothetical protein